MEEVDKNYEPEDFGTLEVHENVERTVEWVDADMFLTGDFIRKKLHVRLRRCSLIKQIIDLRY